MIIGLEFLPKHLRNVNRPLQYFYFRASRTGALVLFRDRREGGYYKTQINHCLARTIVENKPGMKIIAFSKFRQTYYSLRIRNWTIISKNFPIAHENKFKTQTYAFEIKFPRFSGGGVSIAGQKVARKLFGCETGFRVFSGF